MNMTRDKIAVMQAFLEGETIEANVTGHCKPKDRFTFAVNKNHEPVWNWAAYDYKVKK